MLTLTSHVQETRQSVERVIESFLDLPEGWHYGRGQSATQRACEDALKIARLFRNKGANIIEAFPDVDGGILVCGLHASDDVEVLCRADNQFFDMFHENNDVVIHDVVSVSLQDVEQYVAGLSWKSYDYYIQNISGKAKTALQVWPSRNPVMGEFRLFVPPALKKKAKPNVGTSVPTILKELREIHQFFGGSTLQTCRPMLLSTTKTAGTMTFAT